MADPISIDLRQQDARRFEAKDGRYFLDGWEVTAEEAIAALALCVQNLGDRVQLQDGIACGNGYADSLLIEWLLKKSGVTCYQISKLSKIGESTLSRITSGETSMHSIRFGTAIKLTEYARKIQVERMSSSIPISKKGRDLNE
ncbi:hypothetical protein ACPV3A_14675 [Paenibacillus sp. Dod16]|uniref:hypothetical protein n=1 Tax=Paenibacillus sp. Dod16 TaxID=3416392 RepID=UPI003CF195AE